MNMKPAWKSVWKSARFLALFLAAVVLFAQPVAVSALEGNATAPRDRGALPDDYNSTQRAAQSFEDCASGEGSLYDTMTARQKACYDALKEIAFDDIMASSGHSVTVDISGVSGVQLTGTGSGGRFMATGSSVAVYDSICNDLAAAVTALRYDRPDLLWLDGNVSSVINFQGSGSQFTITGVQYQFSLPYNGQEDGMRTRMMAEAESIAREASSQPDMYHKVKMVHDRIAARAAYNDAPDPVSHSAYSALVAGDGYEPVCDGYSKALKIVLNLMGIPCTLVISAEHMWNNVQMEDGLWYNVDLTWDDSRDDGGDAYFLVGSGTEIDGVPFNYQPDHVERDPFQEDSTSGARYPQKSVTAYQYTGQDHPKLAYPDVPPGDYAYTEIGLMNRLGYFRGDASGYFRPGRQITRAEFAKVMAEVLGQDYNQYSGRVNFSDVDAGSWYSGVAGWAKNRGIMVGSNDKFRPNDPISRQEMCVVLARAFGLKSSRKAAFSDDAKISGWAKEGVYACNAAGLVMGIPGGAFNPYGNTVRRDAAIVFARYARRSGAVPSGGQ